jgi:hypothetical protein
MDEQGGGLITILSNATPISPEIMVFGYPDLIAAPSHRLHWIGVTPQGNGSKPVNWAQ